MSALRVENSLDRVFESSCGSGLAVGALGGRVFASAGVGGWGTGGAGVRLLRGLGVGFGFIFEMVCSSRTRECGSDE